MNRGTNMACLVSRGEMGQADVSWSMAGNMYILHVVGRPMAKH